MPKKIEIKNIWKCRICGELAEVDSQDGTFCWRCWSEWMGGYGHNKTLGDLVEKYGEKQNAKT
jgi:hypothetical protein